MRHTAAFLALLACLSGVAAAQANQQIDPQKTNVAKQDASSKQPPSQTALTDDRARTQEVSTNKNCPKTDPQVTQPVGDPDAPQNQVEYRAGG